jgi:hypothetical protein
VSALGHVHILGLKWCGQLTEASTLDHVCGQLIVVSSLGRVHTLGFERVWSAYRLMCWAIGTL